MRKPSRLCSALLSVILLARYLQPEQYGIYNYALAYTSFFVAVSNLGSNQIFTRDLVTDQSHSREIVSTAIALRLFSGTLFSILASTTAFILFKDRTVQLLVAMFSLQMVFRASEAIECFFQSRMEYKHITYSKILASGISTALVAIAVMRKQSIFSLAAASSFEFLVTLSFLSATYVKQKHAFGISYISFSRLQAALVDSWPLILSSIAITIYMRVDQLMISSMSGNSELGLYSAAVQLTEAFYLIPIALVNSTFPKIVRLRKDNEKEFYTSLQSLYNKVSLTSYASVLFVSIFSERLLSILYGENYIGAVPVLRVLIWSAVFVALGVARSSFMVAMNWTKIQLVTVVIASTINVILNYALIPEYGGLGAAIATALSQWFAVHGACLLFKPLRRTGKMITRSLVFIG